MKTFRFDQVVNFIERATRFELDDLKREINIAYDDGDIGKSSYRHLLSAIQKRIDDIEYKKSKGGKRRYEQKKKIFRQK